VFKKYEKIKRKKVKGVRYKKEGERKVNEISFRKSKRVWDCCKRWGL